jgi:hypothetical protein
MLSVTYLRDRKPPFSIGSIANTSLQIFSRQIRKVIQNFGFGHLGSQILKHFIHRNSQAPDTRLTTAFIRLDRDVVPVIHNSGPIGMLKLYRPDRKKGSLSIEAMIGRFSVPRNSGLYRSPLN